MPANQTSQLFLTAEWRHLLMVNYAVDPSILKRYVPSGTELDTWQDTHYVSLVGFNFLHTRIKGLSIPFHANFEEINLRFYVRRKEEGEWKRGVVFIKEIVPKPAIALVARWLYNEKYVARPTRHTLTNHNPFTLRYEWKHKGRWNTLEARGQGEPTPLEEGSEEEFISEHFWGYSMQRKGGTKEYRVEHPSWNTWNATQTKVDVDVATLYGPTFAHELERDPSSTFIADGSEISVSQGVSIK